MERKTITNLGVLENIKPEWTLESRVAHTGLLLKREERGMENDVLLGVMSGKRMRGRTTKDPSNNNMRWDARDRAKGRRATAVVARGRTCMTMGFEL